MESKIETSILFGHYAEDRNREIIARHCLKKAHEERNETTELIIVFNGHYSYRDEFIKYCDQWNERDADPFSGKSMNIAHRLARGNILFLMSNDTKLEFGAVKKCVDLIKKYPKYLVTPLWPKLKKMKYFGRQLEDGYVGCDRAGDGVVCMTKKQWDDIGPFDEVDPWTDGINMTNRRIAKGYTVMITKERLAKTMAPSTHSFYNQMKKYNFRGYKQLAPIYSREELFLKSYGRIINPNFLT